MTESPRPLRRGEFFAQWRRADVELAAAAGGALGVALWAALRARAGTRERLEGASAPSVAALGREVGLGLRTVQRVVRDLEGAGLLRLDRPDGKKAVWNLLPAGLDPGRKCGGAAVENENRPRQEMRGTPAGNAGDPGRKCAPVGVQESRENRERREADDDGDRKSDGTERAEELAGLVRRFGDRMHELTSTAPGSEELERLEAMVEDARDVSAWRKLVELADAAVALSPNLQEADA